MFEVGVRQRLRAVHSLPAQGGSEALPHGHDYVVEWSCRSRGLDEKGYAVDISLLQSCLSGLCRKLEGADLNSLPFFASRAPSLENLAVFLAQELRGPVAGSRLAGSRITIWESADAWASLEEDA
jgi:6-pyruvoyl-tetrahydropterin synthase